MASLSRGPRVLQHPLKPQCQHYNVLRSQSRFLSSSGPPKSSQQPKGADNKQLEKSASETTQQIAPKPQDINAPLSTLPAEILTPAPLPPTAQFGDKAKNLLNTGRAYLSFYKTGLKNVLHNYRASYPLRETLNLPKYRPISPPTSYSQDPSDVPESQTKGLGRGQYQLVRRSARDVRRMIPFALVLMVCGEFTPLIIPIFGSAITPATCRLPSQVAKDRSKASERKFRALQADVSAASAEEKSMPAPVPTAGSQAERELLARFADPSWAASATAEEVLRACSVFGLVGRHDRIGGSIFAGTVYRGKLRRYLEYLAIDDRMIRSGGGVEALSAAELGIALDERGAGDAAAIYVKKPGDEAVMKEREWLQGWLDVRAKKA